MVGVSPIVITASIPFAMASGSTVGPLITVTPEPLSQNTFACFGAVIESQTTPGIVHGARKYDGSNTDTGTASNSISEKEKDPSSLVSLYAAAPSKNPAQPQVSTVTCVPSKDTTIVHDLKRHPYTSLSIVPLNSPSKDSNVANIIVVAPSLPASADSDADGAKVPVRDREGGQKRNTKKRKSRFDVFARARPSPFTNDHKPPLSSVSSSLKDAVATKLSLYPSSEENFTRENSGQPDLSRIRAFRIRDGHSIMLSPGTWYALIVANGSSEVIETKTASPSFVLVRYCNRINREDEHGFKITSVEGTGPVVQVKLEEKINTSFRSKL